MAVDIVSLSFKVDSRDIKKGRVELTALEGAAVKTEKAAKNMEKQFHKANNASNLLARGIALITASLGIRELVNYADTWKLINGRLGLVTNGTGNLIAVQNRLFDIAQRSRVRLSETVDLYSRIARSTKELGKSQLDTLAVTEAINKSLIVSGSSAESSNAAIIQLGQGFASGALRGQELNSVMEQTPRLAEAIAAGMGLTIGQLRKQGAEGKLTAEVVFNALLGQREAIEKEFKKMPITIGQSLIMIKNSFLKYLGTADDEKSISSRVANGIKKIAENFEGAAKAAIVFIGSGIALYLPKIALEIKAITLAMVKNPFGLMITVLMHVVWMYILQSLENI